MLIASRFGVPQPPPLLQRQEQHQQHQQTPPEVVESKEGLLQRRLRTAFDDPTWSDLVLRCRWPTPRGAPGGHEGEPSSPPPSPSSSSSRRVAAEELREGEVSSYHVHRVVLSSWSDALTQLCLLDSSSSARGTPELASPKGDEISGPRRSPEAAKGDGQDDLKLAVLGVVEEDLDGQGTTSTTSCHCSEGKRRKTTVVELQAAEPVDPSALRLLLAFLYSGDLAQALEDATAACRSDGPGCAESNDAEHREISLRSSNLRDLDMAGTDDAISCTHARESLDLRTTAIDRSILVRAAELGLAYGVPELDQQLKSSAWEMHASAASEALMKREANTSRLYTTRATAKAPSMAEGGDDDDDRVESPLDALLAAASQHPLVRAAVSVSEDAASPSSAMAAGGRSGLGGLEGRLRGTTERRAPARYSSPDVEVYKDTWEVRGKRKHAPSASDDASPPTETRRSSRTRAQESDANSDDADVSNGEALDVPAIGTSFKQERDNDDDDLFFSATKRRSSRLQSSDRRLSPTDSNKRMKEELDEEEEDDGEYDQRHESARIIATANKKRRAVAKAKQTRESTVAPPADDDNDNGDEETFTLVENDHTFGDDEPLPASAAIHSRPPLLTSPRRGNDVAVEQPLKTETQVLAAAAASGENRRSLKQLRKEHGKNCHNCKTRKIDFVTCLVRPTHRFCDGCLRKLFNVEFANAHLEWDGIVHREGCAICRHVCPCVGCRKRSQSSQSPAPLASRSSNSSDAARTTKRPRDAEAANLQQLSSATIIANGRSQGMAGSGDNDDAPLTKRPKQQKNDGDDGRELAAASNDGNQKRRRRVRSLLDGLQAQEESEKKLRRSSADVHENEDSVEMVTDEADATPALPSVSTRSRSRRRESTASTPMASATAVSPPATKGARSSRSSRRSGSAASKSHNATAAFNVPEGAGPEAFLGLVSAGSALSQRPLRRTPIRAPSVYD